MKQLKPSTQKLPCEPWVGLLAADPRRWLLQSEEPAARWVALTHLLDQPEDDPQVQAAHAAVLSDPTTEELIGRLSDWEQDAGASGHQSPIFMPNLLHLLADMGLGKGGSPEIEQLLDSMLEHQTENGRFQSFGKAPGLEQPYWGSLLCDTHAITEVMLRFGRADDPRVIAALQRMEADLSQTAQGTAWPCIPDPVSGFRGPGRKGDFCPMVSLEALRTFSRLPESQRPKGLLEVARVLLRAWRMRGSEKPYMFGFGRHFKTVKWPSFWFDLHWMLDTLSRYPELWQDKAARSEDRKAIAEMAACLVAYNFGPEGKVTPQSCYKGFEQFSFGQKKQPSPFATARLAAVLRRFDDLTDDIQRVDMNSLAGSKGGTGKLVLPNRDRARVKETDVQKARFARLIVLCVLMLMFVACTATQAIPAERGGPGFWLGLWQGFIAPITFIISLFPNDVRIYAYPNAGLWYDFGFMLGIGGFSGGIFAGSRRRSR